jgi:predicted phage baseplate assembly protein
VIAWAIEGRFSESNSETSDGTPNQQFTITEDNVLESPINIYVTVGDDTEEWLPIIEPIERYGPNDKVAEINFFDGAVVFKFGDNLAGKIPPPGSKIKFEYRIGGGKQGRIGANQISTNREIIAQPPSNAAVQVRFRNLTPSTGGTDKETLEEVKRRAPNDYSSQRSIVTASDYAQQATSFRHPVFGAVSKASVSLRSSLNANRVDVHILAEGPEDVPAIPSSGLKMGLKTYIESLNVLTDNVFVMDGEFYPVDIDMNVILDRNSDASIVKTKVESEIDKFFDLRKWEMGQPFYTSKFIDAISSVDGVAYVDLFSPSDNILASERLADPEIDGVGVNQLIIEGSRKTSYYYSKL